MKKIGYIIISCFILVSALSVFVTLQSGKRFEDYDDDDDDDDNGEYENYINFENKIIQDYFLNRIFIKGYFPILLNPIKNLII